MKFNKSFMTNFIALLLVSASFLTQGATNNLLLFGGLFALSGALTNQLAIHMIGLLSGVIETKRPTITKISTC